MMRSGRFKKDLKSNMERLVLPPSRACGVCRNRMNEICIEGCAPSGDFKDFEPDLSIPLENLPNLSLEEFRELPGQMRADWVFTEHQAIRRQLNGDELGPFIYRKRSVRVPSYQQEPSLPSNQSEETTLYPLESTQNSNPGDGAKEVAGE